MEPSKEPDREADDGQQNELGAFEHYKAGGGRSSSHSINDSAVIDDPADRVNAIPAASAPQPKPKIQAKK